jgi:hypothetical protein
MLVDRSPPARFTSPGEPVRNTAQVLEAPNAPLVPSPAAQRAGMAPRLVGIVFYYSDWPAGGMVRIEGDATMDDQQPIPLLRRRMPFTD